MARWHPAFKVTSQEGLLEFEDWAHPREARPAEAHCPSAPPSMLRPPPWAVKAMPTALMKTVLCRPALGPRF